MIGRNEQNSLNESSTTGNAPAANGALASQLAPRVAALSSFATRKLVGLAYRAREITQDFWADVQDFRRGKRP
jgi:hypothetical protein